MTELMWNLENLSAGWNLAEGFIKNINLQIKEGERIAFIGSEDSGRAMALRILAGLRPHREGVLEIFNQNVEPLHYSRDWDFIVPQDIRRKMGIALKTDGMLSNVSMREGMEMLIRFQLGDKNTDTTQQAHERVLETCKKLGLEMCMDKRPYTLSSVERRLASFARAILANSSVFLLENPSQDLGDSSRERLWGTLESVLENPRATLLMSTDDWVLSSHFCSRWILFEKYQIVFDGSPREFSCSGHSLAKTMKETYLHRKNLEEKLLKELAS